MIAKIKDCKELADYIYYEFEDEGIKIDVDTRLTKNEYIGVKVDEFYNKTLTTQAPKSVDFLISVDCQCNNYILYIMEFKNVKSPQHLKITDIQEKFTNTINDFIMNRFADIYANDKFVYKDVFLYLISDAYRIKDRFNTHKDYVRYQEFRNKALGKDTLRVDRNLQSKIYNIRGKIRRINYEIPPNPIIKKVT